MRTIRTTAILLAPILFSVSPSDAADSFDITCEMSPVERRLAELLVHHPGQARDELKCDERLRAFARERGGDMAKRGYFGHVTPERSGPNELLRKTGYEMPKYYVGGITNSIESIIAGEDDPDKAWQLFMESPTHRKHLLGENSMYAKQRRFGIARVHVPASDYGYYWIVVIVEDGTSDRPMICSPPPAFCIVG